MKICICTNTRPHLGGVTTYINTLAKYLNLNNNETIIVSPFGVSQQIKIKSGLIKKTDKLTSNKSFITFVLLILSQFLTFINLARAYLKNRYQVIITQDPISVKAAKILKKIFHFTIILTVHDTLEKSLLRQKKITNNDFVHRYVRRVEKKAMATSDGIYTISEYTLNFIKNQNLIPENKPKTIINPPVDPQVFFFDQSSREQIRKNLKINQNQFVILFAGQLSDIKGAIYPLYALREINKIDSNFQLIYTGDGPEKQTIIDLIKKFNFQQQVMMLGKIPASKLREVYNIADVLVIPSITVQGKQDTHPLVAIEAMTCRLPVIASASGGLKEIISDQQTGILFPEKDYKKMAEAIINLKSDSAFRKKIITNAYFHSQNYSPEKIIKKILDFVRICLA